MILKLRTETNVVEGDLFKMGNLFKMASTFLAMYLGVQNPYCVLELSPSHLRVLTHRQERWKFSDDALLGLHQL